MANHKHQGSRIIIGKDFNLQVPDNPIVVFIEGDGVGPDIWKATRMVLDEAVLRAYEGRKRIYWHEAYAGEKARRERVNGFLRTQ